MDAFWTVTVHGHRPVHQILISKGGTGLKLITRRPALLLSLLALLATQAFALPTLRVTDNFGNNVTIADNLAGDLDAGAGVVTWIGDVGAWRISVSTGQTKPFIGTAATPILNINSTATRIASRVNGTAEGSLLFELFEDGFTSTPFEGKLTGSVSSGNASGTATLSSLLDQTAPFAPFDGALYTSTGDALSYNTTSDAVLSVTGSNVVPLVPFSLTLKSLVTMAAGSSNGTVNVDAALTAVPEPGFYGVLAMGLSGIGLLAFRRRNTQNS